MTPATFAQLQAFFAVARSRNFSAAARELGVSRSAVSQAVGQLEAQLFVARHLLVRQLTDERQPNHQHDGGKPTALFDGEIAKHEARVQTEA